LMRSMLLYREIAGMLKVSEPRVCQLHSEAIGQLRKLPGWDAAACAGSLSDYSCMAGKSCDPTISARLRCAWGVNSTGLRRKVSSKRRRAIRPFACVKRGNLPIGRKIRRSQKHGTTSRSSTSRKCQERRSEDWKPPLHDLLARIPRSADDVTGCLWSCHGVTVSFAPEWTVVQQRVGVRSAPLGEWI
jgi:hypothetical protein